MDVEQFRVEVNAFLHETDNAVAVTVGEEKVWFPLSQVHSIHRNPEGDGWLMVTPWIARQKSLL
jgi:hypothetical protein